MLQRHSSQSGLARAGDGTRVKSRVFTAPRWPLATSVTSMHYPDRPLFTNSKLQRNKEYRSVKGWRNHPRRFYTYRYYILARNKFNVHHNIMLSERLYFYYLSCYVKIHSTWIVLARVKCTLDSKNSTVVYCDVSA